MSETALLYVMAAFVIISAIALCIQAAMLVGIQKSAKKLQDAVEPLAPKVENLVPKVETLLEKTNATVDASRQQIAEIAANINDILASTKRQLVVVEGVVDDAAARAKVQMDRIELVVDDTLSRAHETVAVVHDGIMRPLREVNGIAVGIRAALGSLARGSRPTVDRATSDEEMFI